MKPFPLLLSSPPPQKRGVALLSTLILLALVTVLIVTFFFAVGSMREQSSHTISDFRLGALRDTAINAAIEQLRDATTQTGELWASQPGAIRTYDRETGAESQIFKLYSNDQPLIQNAAAISDAATRSLETDVPAAWNTQPTVYVDLNEPEIFASDGQVHFPIVDPRLFDGANNTPEGFSYAASQPVATAPAAGVIPPTSAASPAEQRLPMPVKWIYLLRDGTRGAMNASGKFIPLSSGTAAPSTANPIVGRMAWWVDDESAKVNINTASEAIPWDTPRAVTPEDLAFAGQTPVKNEVQRFGGHPATTSLSAVFFPNQLLDPTAASDRDKFVQIYALTPRVNGGSTGFLASGPSRRQAIAFDDDRLYATVDELLFAPDRSRQPLVQSLGAERLRQLRFLLTANSSAPETTVAGTPRVSLWPVHMDDLDTHRTAYDRLLTRAATIAGRPFYFRRNDSKTSTNEFAGAMASNADLEKYLLTLADRKDLGHAKSFIQKYDGDVAATSRDVENMAVGLVSFLETIRDTNLHDTTIAPGGQPVVPYANSRELFRGTRVPGQIPSTNPSNFANSRGQLNDHQLRLGPLGREYTLSEFGVVFSYAAEHRSDGTKINEPLVNRLNLPPGFKAIQGAAVFEAFCPAQGYTMISPGAGISADFTLVTINGRRPVSRVTDPATGAGTALARWGPYGWGSDDNNKRWLGGQNQVSSDAATSSALTIPNLYEKPWWVGWGGSGGRFMFAGSDTNVGISGTLNPSTDTLSLAAPVNEIPAVYTRGYYIVPQADVTMTLGMANPAGGNEPYVEIGIWARRVGIDRFDHCKFGRFPTTQIPVPSMAGNPSLLNTAGSETRPMTWRERYDRSRANNYADPELVDANDTVRTLVVRHSDYRLAHLRRREHTGPVDSRTYAPHPDYFDSSRRHAHSLTKSGGEPEPQASFQRGLVNTSYAASVTPDFVIPPTEAAYRSQVPAAYPYAIDPELTRDWNNGAGIAPDGAYWNKPDDMARMFDGSTPPYFNKRWDGAQDGGNIENNEETIAPNQQAPSAVLFGSIPSAAGDAIPWTTYLFRPDMGVPHLGSENHAINGDLPGAPPDHRILDWFWMPVVQPYAISEPFSTAGKINLNYRLAPFGYIKRATGLHAVLKSERLLAIPTSAGGSYKDLSAAGVNTGWRHRIDAEQTLEQFETRFDSGRIFRFASEICEQYLVPQGRTAANVQQFWQDHKLTGDNTLEQPYANLYPRLTTQSNAYTVHVVVQTLQKARSTPHDEFVEGQDSVTGRYRGEALVERYIDPNDPAIPDYITAAQNNTSADPLDHFYAWRIRHLRRFAP